jgi:hypothetical protein
MGGPSIIFVRIEKLLSFAAEPLETMIASPLHIALAISAKGKERWYPRSEHVSFPCRFIVRRRVDHISEAIKTVRYTEAIFKFTRDRDSINWKSQNWRTALVSPVTRMSSILSFVDTYRSAGFGFIGINLVIIRGENLVPRL